MRRTLLALTIVAGAVGGTTLARHAEHGEGGVKTLSRRDITEKIDGKVASATTVEVTLEPDDEEPVHHHRWPSVFVLDSVKPPIHSSTGLAAR